ncbi:hypothetical protein GCM10011403_09370 [Pseudohongiella nitratireducens]|uniref:Uncharacterized protein n=1 Tax=Pseudohongiella nitratireducens TaxID=1768907 RepID=A0A917LSI5_9GAMM|nr:hypothetical protein [Pseudohongiella nitratireducens]MDF1623177.1 hypothetical protein [Pseudohongiella nitratireducens]GGG54344.1 hypothetical protein GCM10011403_09370 [Pseudohongiella nitratireducens]|tara:strand:+ start:637 stop:909 length:273 start_codon:yes stop_codon:yes gene_type:complete
MKGRSWDDFSDSAKDYLDAGMLADTEFEDEPETKHGQRRRLTELRRRTEERLDWKRMYGELQFDDLDDERLWDDDQISYQYDNADDMLDD